MTGRVLFALLIATFSAPAMGETANLPAPVREAVAAYDAICRAGGGKPTSSPDLVRAADVTRDGVADYIVDTNYYVCAGAPVAVKGGPGPGRMTVYQGSRAGTALPVLTLPTYGNRIDYPGPYLSFTDLPDCGRADAANILNREWDYCRRLANWHAARSEFELSERPWPAGIGATYWMKEDYSEAMRWFLAGADLGDGMSMHMVASMLAGGQGVKADEAKAVEWWHKAANAGNDLAMEALAHAYMSGLHGLSRDPAQRDSWYRRWAQATNDPAERKRRSESLAQLKIPQ